jgi:nondiscriminating aspartyl-tRNA synthetase
MSHRILSSELSHLTGKSDQNVRIEGWIHRVRDFGGVRFLIVRDRQGMVQVVVPPELDLAEIGCEWIVRVDGLLQREPRAPGGLEVHARHIDIISSAEPPPLEVFKPLEVSRHRLETLLGHRAVSVRIPEVLDVFRVQAEILRSFRAYLNSQDFIEITTPKLVEAGAEGGSAVFEIKYFDRSAYLGQSPQFYKQIMVGSGLERVFEVGHAYRAEKSETSRHLTEFVSLDFEMGFINSEQDVMAMHTGLIRAIFDALRRNCGHIFAQRQIVLPEFDDIPQISFPDAVRVLENTFGKTSGLVGDLDTEGEQLIGQWARAELGSELVYVTGYAMDKRPMYTIPMDDDPSRSRSFDLLYQGIEITTGSQRIHNYSQLVDSIRRAGLDPAEYEGYLATFKHGMPPHGGMGMGLERLTMQVLHLPNIRQACLFPRDRYRLSP